MRWKKARRSENVEDHRGTPGARGAVGKKAAVGGIGGIVVLLISMYFGVDVSKLLGTGAGASTQTGQESAPVGIDDEASEFVRHVLGDTEQTWNQLFAESGLKSQMPKLHLFRDSVGSACGIQGAATGPFYCPADRKIYIDLSFYDVLKQRLGAPGDFAQAYVIAHEVGHHIQNLLGTSRKVHGQQRGMSEAQANDLSVRLELQADFYAGAWAHYAAKRGLVEPGDYEEALRAAAAIGDDTLQKKAGARVRPESFTHGTSEQRVRWFRKGLETGDMRQGDTFSARRL